MGSNTPILHHSITPALFTIGAFGYTESGFFEALKDAEIDTFCDIRRRRGVRGAEFAFVNSARLQARLAEMGIRYLHLLELAPTEEVRAVQTAADKESGTAKRKRSELSPVFVEAYRREILGALDSRAMVEALGSGSRKVVLFCVERNPESCHRSLVAQRLESDLGIRVRHLIPE